MNKIAIIGGGAAGTVAAITAAAAGASVDLFELNSRIGKKILASGNGRCNISNTHLSQNDYFGIHPEFVTFALSQFGFSHFQKFCTSIGLLLNSKEDGRTYPLSDEAKSVVLALESYMLTQGVTLHCETQVKKIEKAGQHFTLLCDDQTYGGYDRVLITTGSEAAPQLGANADGYHFAKALGHAVEPTYPALVALELDSKLPAKMSGVKQSAEVTLYINGKAEQRIKGDILFTRYGISGFAILDISQQASSALQAYSNVDIGLKLLPDYDRQSLSTKIAQLCKTVPSYTVATLLSGLISSKMTRAILEEARVPEQTLAGSLSTKMIKQIANIMMDWRFSISDTHGFKHAEVSGGGVSTDEVNEKTMESKKVKGLYFAGEVLDIVGRRGGYNLHFAWASGYLAGKSLST